MRVKEEDFLKKSFPHWSIVHRCWCKLLPFVETHPIYVGYSYRFSIRWNKSFSTSECLILSVCRLIVRVSVIVYRPWLFLTGRDGPEHPYEGSGGLNGETWRQGLGEDRGHRLSTQRTAETSKGGGEGRPMKLRELETGADGRMSVQVERKSEFICTCHEFHGRVIWRGWIWSFRGVRYTGPQ